MSGRVVIVGSGQAGVSAAFTLVGEEPVMPYQRPPLSKKYLTAAADADRLLIKAPALYESERITVHTDCRVTAIDRARQHVQLAHGQTLAYDHLILATGATPRPLPGTQTGPDTGIYTFRTLADAERLRPEMRPGRRLLVIGGGYIGLETAAVARGLGLEVTLVERDPRILGRVAAAETAAWFKALHLANGVRILENTSLQRLPQRTSTGGTAWQAHDQTLEADVVVVGIGVVPETGLAEQAGLQVDNGIVVDAHGRTSDPCI